VLSGDLDRAERERAVLAVRAREDGIPWLTVVDHRAAGLIAWRGDREVDGRDALAHFQAALEVIPDGYEGARTRLLLGEFLADRASRQEAREVLDRAATEFDRLGARPFAERARQVLGDRVIDLTGPPSRLRVLTGQEHQVAVAVAEGLSNKEIAARLFISTKTVEHHLTRSYQKLGIRSRTELARRILLESGTPAKS
jgi:DNA-binding CsgD family transcriptional regulator